MSKLLVRSVMVLALLFGLVFAVGAGVLYYYNFPVVWGLGFAVVVVLLQYITGPFIIDWIFKISWMPPDALAPEFGEFLRTYCGKRGVKVPRFGIIEDGNPNAFTYGHGPWNARLVVTRGLLQMLEKDEYEAVVAHEIGHIRHYDFIVMTIASLVPLILYILYAWTKDRKRDGGYALAVAVGAYIAYIISQYIVLLLSRVREYFADENAAQTVDNANSIATALIKIAYGLAKIPQEEEQTDAQGKKKQQPAFNRSRLMGSLGVCNFSSSTPMALYSTTTTGQFSTDHMMRAMQWDLWNPWAKFFEIQSTHPLVAHRVREASRVALKRRQQPAFPVSMPAERSYWGSFVNDLIFLALPWIGAAIGLMAAYGASGHNPQAITAAPLASLQNLKYVFLFGGIGWLARLGFSYGGTKRQGKVVDLVGELEVSHIRSIPVELEGQIIGRGVPGLFWSKDLVMQDDSGFITMLYKQPLGILETLFGLFKAERLVGKKGKFTGWYRRGPAPYFELRSAEFEDGDRVNCHYYSFLWFGAIVCTLVGVYMSVL